MTPQLVPLDVRSRQQWRTWLGKHHASSPGVWLVFHKGHTGVKSIPYEDSVREALCFGWIDSLIKCTAADNSRTAGVHRERLQSASDSVAFLSRARADSPA